MSNTAVPLTNVGGGYTIVTHVAPPQSTEQNVTTISGPLQKFLKGEPKALGTVQIMIGLLTLMLNIVKIFSSETFVFFGAAFWGSLFYIVAGSLAVSASNKLHRCVVTGTLVLNIFSCIAAAGGILVYSLNLAVESYRMTYVCGITGVLLVFTLLQFFVSIYISAFACKATCNHEPVLNVTVVQNPAGYYPVPNPISAPENPEVMYAAQSTSMDTRPMENPPPYSDFKGLAAV